MNHTKRRARYHGDAATAACAGFLPASPAITSARPTVRNAPGPTTAAAATAASIDSACGVWVALDGPISGYVTLANRYAIHLDQHRGVQAVACIVKHEAQAAASAARQRTFGCEPWYSHAIPPLLVAELIGYYLVARNRYRISRWLGLDACRVSPQSPGR